MQVIKIAELFRVDFSAVSSSVERCSPQQRRCMTFWCLVCASLEPLKISAVTDDLLHLSFSHFVLSNIVQFETLSCSFFLDVPCRSEQLLDFGKHLGICQGPDWVDFWFKKFRSFVRGANHLWRFCKLTMRFCGNVERTAASMYSSDWRRLVDHKSKILIYPKNNATKCTRLCTSPCWLHCPHPAEGRTQCFQPF